jgi:MFS family permease
VPVRNRLRDLRVDLGPLRRHRDYRLLFTSGAITMVGSFITFIAAPVQIKQLTDSYLAVGLIGLAEFVPTVVCGMYGGVIADSRDRRRTAVVCELALMALISVLVINAMLPDPHVWPVFLAAGLIAGVSALQRPSLDALLPRTVPKEDLHAAIALLGMRSNIGAIAAPAIGGVLAAHSLPLAYSINAVTFALSALLLLRLGAYPPAGGNGRIRIQDMAVGVRYAIGRRDLLGTYAVDVAAMVLAIPLALYPFLADDYGHPGQIGLLFVAMPTGAAVASALSGWTKRIRRQGLAVAWAAAAWGASLAIAGLMPSFWLLLLFLACAGAADMVSGIFRLTLWNTTIPDDLRGRMAGLEMLSYTVGPMAGGTRAALMADAFGVRASVAGGGALCLLGVGAASAAFPALRKFDIERWRQENQQDAAQQPA